MNAFGDADRTAGKRHATVAIDFSEGKAVAIGTGKTQAILTEEGVGAELLHALFRQSFLPEAERALRYGEHRFRNFTGTATTFAHIGKGEIGHDRAGIADFVAIIEVVDIGSIEVDGLLDPAQTESLRKEAVVFLGIRGHRGNVMQAFDLGKHGSDPFPALAPVLFCWIEYRSWRSA